MKSIAWTVGGYCARPLGKASWISRISPNLLTLLWGCSIAAAGVLIGIHGFTEPWILFPLIAGGVFVDCLDGLVARNSYRQSALGGSLDNMMHLLGDTALLVGATSYLSTSSGGSQGVWIAGVSLLVVHVANWRNTLNLRIDNELLDLSFQPRWSQRLNEVIALLEPIVPMAALLGLIIGPAGFLLLCAAIEGSTLIHYFSMLFVVEHRTVNYKQQTGIVRVPARLASQREKQRAAARNRARSREKKR